MVDTTQMVLLAKAPCLKHWKSNCSQSNSASLIIRGCRRVRGEPMTINTNFDHSTILHGGLPRNTCELTILMPCLNEAETIEACIISARILLSKSRIDGEILISDNGSTDGSQAIARNMGSRVVDCPIRGYGASLQYGIENARGEYILMGDSDDSYHFNEAMAIIDNLRNGYDVCMGTRLNGMIKPGAMPLLNRYLGNPVLTAIGKWLFRIPTSDFHCGMRGFRAEAIRSLSLVTTGMEWASEMVIKSKLAGLKMTEVPITLHKDGRSRPPHLKRWRDGWRHLRFMLAHAPTALFFVPAFMFLVAGLAGEILFLPGMSESGNSMAQLGCAIAIFS